MTMQRGISRTGVIVVVVCAAVVLALILLLMSRLRRDELSLREQSRLREIHSVWITYVREWDGVPELPGPDLGGAQGNNTTAILYSALIMQNYLNPDRLVSPFERNPVVVVDRDYDYETYDPAEGTFWDPGFVADLRTGSNVSYGHRPLAGAFLEAQLDPAPAGQTADIGNRGPADGVASPDSLSCRASGLWIGSLVFRDHHVEHRRVAPGEPIRFDGDNPFNADPETPGLDQVVAFTKKIEDGRPVLQHD